MGKPRLFIVIVALALATMACSLGSANKASDSQTPKALPPVTALVQSASPVSTPAPTQTAVPTATAVAAVAEVAPEVNDLGIIDDANGANSASPSNGGGEGAVAIESLSSIQNVEAQFYIPNCMPVTD